MITLALMLACLGPILQDQASQEVFRFEIDVRTVYVDVFVTRQGQPIAGLTEEDFEVLDNGVRQEIKLMDANALPLATMLLLDVSGSVEGDKLEQLRAAAHAFVERLEPEDEVGLMTFTRLMELRMEPSNDFAAMHRVLLEPTELGDTSLHDALYSGLKLVEARGGRPLVVLFTDGLDNMSWLNETEVLDVLKESDVVVYAVAVEPGMGASVRRGGRSIRGKVLLEADQYLHSITSLTGGRVFYIDVGDNLEEIFVSVLEEMQSRYLLSYEPRGVDLEGWHELKVRVKDHGESEIRSRPGYLVRSIEGQ
jgi:VWFA-related protein